MANGENKPTPDPTILTTEQLLREVERVKELMECEVTGLKRELVERLISIDKQFDLIERQRVEQKKDTKDAVDAALAAAKEAVKEQTTASERAIAKSENSTAEQLKQLSTTFTTAIGGVTNNHDDLKERVGKVEGVKQGIAESRSALSAGVGLWIGALGLLLSVSVVVIALLATQ